MAVDIRQLIVDYMSEQKLMQLATVGENGPWVCNVWQAFDDDLNIYFFSATNRQHSQDIEKDNRVAGALAKLHAANINLRALQFSGTAEKLTDPADMAKARSLHEGRAFDTETIDKLTANPDRPHAFYKITPQKFVLFDTVNFPDNPRQEYIP